MGCDVSGEQLWSWIDRNAPGLDEHLAACPTCRARAAKIREDIEFLASDLPAEIPVPDRIGPYAVRRLIGEGGQALVYEAEQESPRRLVAIKLLKGGHFADKTRLRHFRREIQTLGSLNHPAIATIYEAGRTAEGLHYFAMELVEGVPLHSFVKEKKPPRKDLLKLFEKICRAVQHAHERGVIHRDLKPSNVMIKPDGEPKILDFGLARMTQRDVAASLTLTKEGQIEGTPLYMSPEQLRGVQDDIDHRTDVYALGVIFYELLTGVRPAAITTITPAAIKTICEEMPAIPSRIDTSLRGDLDAIAMMALEKKKEDRYQSAGDLADDIARYLRGDPVRARRPTPLYFLRKKAARWAPHLIIGLVIAAAATVVLVTVDQRRREWSPDDLLSARTDLLQVRHELLAGNPSPLTIERAGKAPTLYPALPEAVLVAAQASYFERLHSEAGAELTRAARSDTSQWAYGMLMREIELSLRPSVEPSTPARAWDAELARSADAWYLRSFATLNADSALAWAREALARDARHVPACVSVAYLSELRGDMESFLGATESLIRDDYRADDWLRLRAEVLLEAQRFEDALAECDRMIERWPDAAGAHSLRARIARRAARYEEAEQDFTFLVDIGGGNHHEIAWWLYHRGTVRWLLGRSDEAEDDYRKAHEYLMRPTYVTARLYILLRNQGRITEAGDLLADARRSRIDDPWLGDILECLGGTLSPEGLAAIGESTRDPVKICEGYYYAGEAELLALDADGARAWFEKCRDTGVACDPEDPLESQSEFELAGMRLTELARRRTATNDE